MKKVQLKQVKAKETGDIKKIFGEIFEVNDSNMHMYLTKISKLYK